MKKLNQYKLHIFTPKDLYPNYNEGVSGNEDLCRVEYEGIFGTEVDTNGKLHESVTQVSENWFLDAMYEIFEPNAEVFTKFITVKWGRLNPQDDTSMDIVEGLLKHGVYINGVLYKRLFRSPSAKRAGGCILTCLDRDELVKFYGLNVDLTKPVNIAKYDAMLALILTSSHRLGSAEKPFNPRIRIVADMQRIVKENVKTIDKSPNAPNPLGKDELSGLLYDVIQDFKGNPDVRYKLITKEQDIEVQIIDGCGVCTEACDNEMNDQLQLTDSERKYAVGKQIRAPYLKGMIVKFGIVEWCDEHDIEFLIDIYGDKFNPREVDMILPKSMFKGAGFFNHMSEYDEAINNTFTVGNWFRVANISKEKDPWHETTYQYLQVLNLTLDNIIKLATPFTSLINKGVTEDILVAKQFLNMVVKNNDYTNYVERSMISKAQELLELCPALFHNKFVQRQIIKTVKTSIEDMKGGRVPIEGSYHYIIGDVTLLFVNAIYKEGSANAHLNSENVNRNGGEKVFTQDDVVGIIPKGVTYCPGKTGVALGFRSPLIHMSETAKLSFNSNSEVEKWFGHLTGIVVMNSYESTALGMGGADFDGDKIYVTFNEIVIKGYMPNLPIIVSPLEGGVAKSTLWNWDNVLEGDLRSLDNKTGLYTNMATYYVNKLYDLASRNQASDFIREEFDYKLTILRIAQAGEIDYPKHGLRFYLPSEVVTFKVPHWLRPDKPEKKAPILNTPMEQLFGYTDSILMELDKNLPAVTLGTEKYLMGVNIDKYEVSRIMPYVVEYENQYRNELFALTDMLKKNPYLKDIDEGNYVRDMFKDLYTKYIDLCTPLTTDRKALAHACVVATFKEGHKNNSFTFPFLVAYDGILQNLAEYDFTSLRIVSAKALDKFGKEFSGTIQADGSTASYEINGNPFTFELDTELPAGRYDLIVIKGKHYVQINYRMTQEEKNTIIQNSHMRTIEQDLNKADKVAHKFDVVKGIDYTFTIAGFGNKAFMESTGTHRSAVEVKNMLVANNNTLTLKAFEQKGTKQVGVFSGDQILGIVSNIDGYDTDLNVDLSSFIGHSFKVEGYGDTLGKYTKKPIYTLKVTIIVESSRPFMYDLDNVHARCDMSKWYWNTEWKKFSDFGYNFEGLVFNTENAPQLGDVFAQVNVSINGVVYSINVQRTNEGVTPINAVSNGITYGVDSFPVELRATILRCVSYFFAKRTLERENDNFLVQLLKDLKNEL